MMSNRKNLALIVIDCLRRDRLGCYGAADSATPTVDALAEGGTVFEQAIAMGFHTLSTMPAVITSTYPSTYGGFRYLSRKRPRLPRALKAAGYKTAAFVPNPYLYEERGYRPGFDHFDECWPVVSRRGTNPRSLLARGVNRLLRPLGVYLECPPYLNAASVTDRAIDWLEGAEEPFFLWIHYMDAHTPYYLPSCKLLLPGGRGQRPYDGEFWKRLRLRPDDVTARDLALAQQLYDQGVRFIDGQIARLQRAFGRLGLLEETTFVLTADHGEMFYEHGAFGHSAGLYEELVHVPLVVAPASRGWPERFAPQVRQLDLAPTLITLAGGEAPDAMQGVNLLPALEGDVSLELPAISQTNPKEPWLVSLREPPWKLIWRVDPHTLRDHWAKLYHLDEDPAEEVNRAEDEAQRVAQMKARLREHIRALDFGDLRDAPGESVDPEIAGRLQALGYMDDV